MKGSLLKTNPRTSIKHLSHKFKVTFKKLSETIMLTVSMRVFVKFVCVHLCCRVVLETRADNAHTKCHIMQMLR